MMRNVSNVAKVGKNFILILALTLCACSLFNKEEPSSDKGESITAPKLDSVSMNLFYPKSDGTGLSKIQVQVDDVQKNPSLWFAQLLIQLAQAKSSDTIAVFPEKIEFYSLFLDKDTMYLDFSNTIQKAVYSGIQAEQLALEAFLASIKANFPLISQVKIMADHEDAQTIFGHTYAQQPFSLKDL